MDTANNTTNSIEAISESVAALHKTVRHFFPSIRSWIDSISDPRRIKSTQYPIGAMIWLGILLFLLKLEARRQITYRLRNYSPFLSHLNALAGTSLSQCPHDDAVADLFMQLYYKELDDLRVKMIRVLIRAKVLEYYRLFAVYYTIAIDGTGVHYYSYKHCEHCLTKKSSKTGEILYYHNVLEAKLVTPDGFAFSIATEFIENSDDYNLSLSGEKQKQDCELKAFKRLAPKLKNNFPQLKICLLLDSLYAAQTVLAICKLYHWEVIISFKEGSIPTVYQDHCSLRQLQPENFLRWTTPGNAAQNITWSNGIEYEGYTLALVECLETINVGKANENNKTFVYLTTIMVTKDRARALVNEGGRQRWNIEEGFNTQKNLGYELEHVYCCNENASKGLYYCLQIAHIINQLFEQGSLIAALRKKLGSIKNLTFDLLLCMLTQPIDPETLESLFISPFQIRLNSS